MAGFFDTSGKQPAAIEILLFLQTDTAGKEEKDLEIQTKIRDHLQGDLTKTFSLGRTNIIVFHRRKEKYICMYVYIYTQEEKD